jgi:glutamine amidotransferase
MVGIIDYGCGNVQSILNMHTKIGVWAETISDPSQLSKFDSLILPGVGSFDRGVNELKNKDFWSPIKEIISVKKTPLLGICLGMQLLFENSEEGKEEGLGVFKGSIIRFDETKVQRIPNMGWKPIEVNKSFEHNWLSDSDEEFYFVHAYHAPVHLSGDEVVAFSNSPMQFPAIVQKDTVVGIQFHPEKSLKAGMNLFTSYYKYII